MDTNEAIEYLKQMHGETDSQPVEPTETSDVPETTGVQDTNTNPVPESDAESGREPPEANEAEAAAEQKQQKKPSKQEKINHAFQRVNKRHKAEIEAKDKRIAELEERVKKYSVLEQGDFNPDDVRAYIDHKIALNEEQSELKRLKDERTRLADDDLRQESAERHQHQVQECFADAEAQEHYWTLLRNGGDKFRQFLNEFDDGSIDQFIGDSDIAPLMISTLMRNPDTLRSIVEKRNPMRKMIALQQLENRLQLSRKLGSTRQAQPVETQQQKPKTAQGLPIIGSQVQTPGSSSEQTRRDWNRWLVEHPL